MKLLGQHADLLGYAKMPSPLAVDDRRGAVLYDAPLTKPADVKSWIMEGPERWI